MKTMTKRIYAFLLVLALCLGMLPALEIPAEAVTVDYIYAGNYIKNWGTRGTIATFLSPKAEEFYEDNNTSYELLSSLSGSSSEKSIPSSTLYKAVHNLMESNHDYITSYNATKDLFQYTDCQNSGKTSDKISSFYSGVEIGPSWNGEWNREHTWPNSKGDQSGSGENDLMMLRPTSTSENSSRGNKAYGQSNGYYDPNSGSNGKYDLRGDVARIILYVYVRWECTNTGSNYNPDGIFGTDGVFESKEVLLDWMEEDPVDTWELGRNDSAESILGTRNVFVDYPELSFILFGADIPENYATPSGNAAASSHRITAVSNNADWGTVSVSGRTINASPKNGYEVSGYTLLDGTAQITRSGNAFAVTPSSDVAVQINFAARSKQTVKFSQLGNVVSTQTAYSNDLITLPGHTGTVQPGYSFMGWVEMTIEETTKLPALYQAGSKYTVARDITLYALYARSDSGAAATGNVFSPYSGALTEGDYIIVYDDCGMIAADTGKNRLSYAEIVYTDGDIVSPNEDMVWHIAPSDSYWTLYNADTGKYAAGTGTKNTAKLIDSETDYARWSYSGGSTYEFVNLGNDAKGVNPLLRKNGTHGFACYAKNTNVGGPLSLYKRVSDTVYYFTGATDEICNHADARDVAAKAPTCTESGYTAGVYCPDCEKYLSGHEVLPANGHNFVDGICSVCSADALENAGDLDGDEDVDEDDAIYLLQHVLMPEFFQVTQDVDYDGSGQVNEDDAIYLLQHVLMPEYFPL